ncbi:5-formyltetrahydrofolate cyclo-ligase [Nocardioides jishulii]|uniref:5-formyltetrahydrofolate cyclo-ligase n=1 Tax=Nocardioides jishulii TaxID=2575440 RepID=A0A4U2YVD4_9ACTN|nr:5-formyltetrahydrofolate cyclo-ligase [Nocardioides jishulii]TKI64935.1 5-formyltetrahydrofolate cyclo-ligase [Nocardioides jishulii]
MAAKKALRRTLLAARAQLGPDELEATAERLSTHVLALPQLSPGACVAAYVSSGSEPGTHVLLERLREAGVRVLLPVLLADDDLDWAEYAGADALVDGLRRTRHPSTQALGKDAVAEADVVLVPGVAVSTTGHRLGRGGGSYDRALARVEGAFVAVLLHPGEVGQRVPVEAHDQVVDAAITRDGVLPLG